jgi:heme exporter protein B
MLLILLIVPLSIPALIFGAGAVSAVDAGQSAQGHFSLLGLLLIFTVLSATSSLSSTGTGVRVDAPR